MTDRRSTRAQAAVLSAVLRVLRERDHFVRSVVVHPTGEIEIRIGAKRAPPPLDPLEQWRAERQGRSDK